MLSHCFQVVKNKFDFWNVYEIMTTLALLQSKLTQKASQTSQESRSIHESMNRLKFEFIAYIFI